MPEPVTVISSLCIAGLGVVAGTVVEGIAGNVSHSVVCDLTRDIRSRVAGLAGRPSNHHIARAVREAQLRA
ncbi:MAG: hypothetical protein KIT00_03270, partial [Rhodospirillales bacterium]|nr:hypothetical protein [Rhodospirillales bacterium]